MRFVMNSAMFLSFLLLCLFTTTRALEQQLLFPRADVNVALELCKPILQTRNLSDPSLPKCCDGLRKIKGFEATLGAKATCQCDAAALDLNLDIGPDVDFGVGVGVALSSQLQERCDVDVDLSVSASDC